MKFIAVFFAAVLTIMCSTDADSHPTFTATYLRNNSDLIVVCKIEKIRRVDRPVDNPHHEQAFNLEVTVLDQFKGTPPAEESIVVAHLRTDYGNKRPIDFGEPINQKLLDLKVNDEIVLSKKRLYLLAYLKSPEKKGKVYFPVSTNHWEHYSFHLLSGQFNSIKEE
jgi:hypothetical protein